MKVSAERENHLEQLLTVLAAVEVVIVAVCTFMCYPDLILL